jgi:toxin ParE1/3/4
MRVLQLSRYVEKDLDGIADFIAQDNPKRAVTFIQDIRQKFHHIQQQPLIYQLRSEIGGGARMATVGNYAILFRIIENVVRIERVVYAGRHLSNIFESS